MWAKEELKVEIEINKSVRNMRITLNNGVIGEGTPEELKDFLAKWLYAQRAINTNIIRWKNNKKNK